MVYVKNSAIGITDSYVMVKLTVYKTKDSGQLAIRRMDVLVRKEQHIVSSVLGSKSRSALDFSIAHAIRSAMHNA